MDATDVLTVMLTLQMAMFSWLILIERRLSRLEGYIYKKYNDNSIVRGEN